MGELNGTQTTVAKTWVNDNHGASAGEIEILEEIVKQEKSVDEVIDEPDQETTHIINEKFDTINIIIEVTPYIKPEEEEPEEEEVVEEPKPETKIAVIEEEPPMKPTANIHPKSPEGLANPDEEDVLSDPDLLQEALKEAQEDEDE